MRKQEKAIKFNNANRKYDNTVWLREIMTKKSITITLPVEYVKWLEKKVQSHDYGSISHGITLLIRNEINREEVHKNE